MALIIRGEMPRGSGCDGCEFQTSRTHRQLFQHQRESNMKRIVGLSVIIFFVLGVVCRMISDAKTQRISDKVKEFAWDGAWGCAGFLLLSFVALPISLIVG